MKKLVSVMGVFLILFAVIFAAGCVTTDQQEPTQLKIATTTSLYDTGLLDAVQDYYLEKFNVDLLITSQGTGKAIASAKNGDVDVLLVHSPAQKQHLLRKDMVLITAALPTITSSLLDPRLIPQASPA